jgi:hypothetical protein
MIAEHANRRTAFEVGNRVEYLINVQSILDRDFDWVGCA